MTLTTLIAKANDGPGTDQLAMVTTPQGLAAATVAFDAAGVPHSAANPAPVAVATLPLPAGAATQATLAAIQATVATLLKPGEAIQVSNFPATQAISAAVLPLPAGAASEATLATMSAKLATSTSIPDNQASGIAVRPIGQDTWAASFTDVGANFITPLFRAPEVTGNASHSQASGSLIIASGTTANAEFLTRSTTAWRATMQLRWSLIASQRIANTNFAIMLADLIGENLAYTINSATSVTVAVPGHSFTALNVGQAMMLGGISGVAGRPGRYVIASVVLGASITFTVAGWPASGTGLLDLFGHSYVRNLYTGVTATAMNVDAQRRGWATGDTVAAINTTAALGHIAQAHLMGREITWADTLRASATTPNMTTRASRFENLPDDNVDLYLFLWSFNGPVAPASSTNWTIGFVSVEKFANLPVYIQGQEMQGTVAPAPVAVVGTVPVSGTLGATSPLTVAGVSIEASSAKVASGNNAGPLTNASGRGAIFFVNVTAVAGTGPTLAVRLQVQDPVGLGWADAPGAITPSITAAGLTILCVYPGIAETANVRVNYPLPRTYRMAWTIGGTGPSFTFSVGAQYII